MKARLDTSRQAIQALWRQRAECRKKGSKIRLLLHRNNVNPDDEVRDTNRRIRLIIRAIRSAGE